MKRLVLFDLDGTLTESAPGITRSILYALRTMGVEGYTEEELEVFVGPPLIPCLINEIGLSQEEADQALLLFRERFETIGKYENALYPGVEEMLEKLKGAGIPMGVASSKPEKFVREILDHFHVLDYFSVTVGAAMDETRTEKHEVITEALRRAGYSDHKEDVLMVGDTRFDMLGASRVGVPAVGVTYGYGVPHEMEDAGAIRLLRTVPALTEYLLEMAE